MRSVCLAWLDHRVAAQGAWAGSRAPGIADAQPITRESGLLGLAFQIEPAGFIVVPACKELCPVFFFSETGSLDLAVDTLTAGILGGRLALATEVAAGRAGRSGPKQVELVSAASEKNRARWAQMAERGAEWVGKSDEPVVGVGPLLSTAWFQGLPFNLLCPVGLNGVRCVAGCTPLAAAQIARYHAYPPYGTGEEDFYWNGDHCGYPPSEGALLHADFTDAYDWDQMPDTCFGSCGGVADSAVAELCYELGVGGHVDYGSTCGSTAIPEQLVLVLQEHFGYNTDTEAVYRINCADAHEWFNLLRDEINALCPILYAFVYWSGGQHTLVCDGWRVDNGIEFISLNLGSGSVAGWYAVDDNGMSDPMQDYAILHLSPPASIVTVGPGGTGDYPTIQAAIDAVSPRTIIELLNGVYTGPGNRDLNCGGKQIKIRSQSGDPANCVIDCQGSASDPHRAFVFNHQETWSTEIQGITLRNGQVGGGAGSYTVPGGAVYCEAGASPVFKNCVFSNNRSDQGGAIGCCGESAPRVENCVFWKNSAREGGAYSKIGAGEVQISASTFYGNDAGRGSAIHVGAPGSLILTQSIMTANGSGAVVRLAGGGTAQLSCCDLYANPGGDWTGGIADQLGQTGNISADPMFCNAEAGNLGLDADSPCADPACGLMGARPASCGEFVYYVGAAPQYPYHTIADALADATGPGRIVLVDSLYTGDGNRDLYITVGGLTIESGTGDPADCVLDLQSTPVDPHRGFRLMCPGGATLRGITMRHGRGTFGGAILVADSDSTEILNCVFQDCTAGGPAYARGGAVMSFAGTVFPGRLTIKECLFERCTAIGYGGAVCTEGDVRADTTFIENCTFSSNTASYYGGALAAGWDVTVKVADSVFHNNSSAHGGAVMTMQDARACFESSTLVGNAATVKGGCAYLEDSGIAASFTGCIFASTEGRPPIECQSATVSVSCCDFWHSADSTWAGCATWVPDPANHNIFLDPQFCDLESGDFRPAGTSPCAPDQPGNPGCGLVGALPAGCQSSGVPVGDEAEGPSLSLLRCVPNPFDREIRIDYAVPARAAGRPLEIMIYEVGGRRVRTLFAGAGASGRHSASWNARDAFGRRVGSGIYFCRLRVGSEETSQRLIVLR